METERDGYTYFIADEDPNFAQVAQLVQAMNDNNAGMKYTPYRGYEITETRTKYHLLNSILSNGQRSAVFMIDRKTLEVKKADGYGKAGRSVGTVAYILADMEKHQ